jgi:four helix bundle protein
MDHIVGPKSYKFALRCVELYKWLIAEKNEAVLSKQLLRSGTSIGASVREATHAQSKADFINKMNVALKEASETEYWLMLLKDSRFMSDVAFVSMHKDCDEIIRLLASIVKTAKENLKK